MATVRNRYVDPDVVGGSADGTSWANAYSSLNAAEQAEDNSGDIVTSNEYVVFHCRGVTNADTAAVTINGWTTGASDNYIEIVCDSGDRHSGVWTTSKYRLVLANSSPLTISEEYVRITALQIHKSGSNFSAIGTVTVTTIGSGNAIWISACLVRQAGNASYTEPHIAVLDADATVYIWNTITYGGSAGNSPASSGLYVSAGTVTAYSCTFIGGHRGVQVQSGATATCKNCYAYGNGGNDYTNAGTLTATYCASADLTADDFGATGCVVSVAYSTATFANVTAGSEDYHLVAGSALIGVGTDTSGESAPLNFTTDIAGITRS